MVMTVISLFLIAGLIVGAYLLGRRQGNPEPVSVEETAPGREEADWPTVERGDLATFDEVLQLMAERKLTEARDRLVQAREAQPELPFSDYLLGRLLIATGDPVEGGLLLQKSAKKGEMTGKSLLLSAQSYARMGRQSVVLSRYFEDAILADPLDSDPFFHYGRELRKKGKKVEAVEAMQQASIRASGSAETPIIAVVLTFTRLENDTPDTIAALQKITPEETSDPYALISAAALAALKEEYSKEVTLLTKARELMTPDLFQYFISDQIFETSRSRPEIRPLLERR